MCHPRNPSPEIAKAGKPVAVSGHVIRVVAILAAVADIGAAHVRIG